MIVFEVGHPMDVILDLLPDADKATLNEIAESEQNTPGELTVEMMSWMLAALRGGNDSRPIIILNPQGFAQKEGNHG